MLNKSFAGLKSILTNVWVKKILRLSIRMTNDKSALKLTCKYILNAVISTLFLLSFAVHLVWSDSQVQRTALVLRAAILQRLNEVQMVLENEQYAEGKSMLDDLYKAREEYRLNPLELAYVYHFYGTYFYCINDYKKSIEFYKKILAIKEVTNSMKAQALYALGQLAFSLENYGESLEYLLSWNSIIKSPSAEAYMMVAQVYYQIKNYREALDFVEKSIALYSAAKKQPKENWLQLQAALYFEEGDILKTIKVYKKLLAFHPKKKYYLQLSKMYGESEQFSKQLSIMQAAYRIGVLNAESELLDYVYRMLAQDLPYQAAEVLKESMSAGLIESSQKNLTLLGNAYYQAHEFKKATSYLKEAASLSEEGDIWMMLAVNFLHLEQFDDARQAARSALTKKSLKNPGMTYMVLGTALLNLKQFKEAKQAFKEAALFKKTHSQAAEWLDYALTQEQQHKQMKAWLGL